MNFAETQSPPHATQPVQTGAYSLAEARDVRTWIDSGQAILIDVREADEHARERIPGAKLHPLSGFNPAAVAAEIRPGTKVVLHCKGGKRSADAARMLCETGVAGGRVMSLSGGIEGWKQAGLAVAVNTAVSRLSIVRQTQLAIGLVVVAGSALSWFMDPRFIIIPGFMGLGLTVAGASGTCALASLLARMPWNRGGDAACQVAR